MLSGEVLNIFSVKLNEVIALSFFIPMLIGMGGNVGTQSPTTMPKRILPCQMKATIATIVPITKPNAMPIEPSRKIAKANKTPIAATHIDVVWLLGFLYILMID